MPKYNSCVKKTRSQLQQTHTKSLSQRRIGSQRMEIHPKDNSSTCVSNHSSSELKSIIKQKDRKIEALLKDYKRLVQRDKRAKVENLQEQENLACERLSDACKSQESAEKGLDDAKKKSVASALEIQELQQQLGELRAQVTECSRSLVTTSLELESQLGRVKALEARQEMTDRRRDAMPRGSSVLLPANIAPEYHLKGSAGVIRPEIRDMMRKLACQGVSTEQMSEVINIVAEGLGMRVVGSVSARIMLEGLVQARIQVAQELNITNSFTICGDAGTVSVDGDKTQGSHSVPIKDVARATRNARTNMKKGSQDPFLYCARSRLAGLCVLAGEVGAGRGGMGKQVGSRRVPTGSPAVHSGTRGLARQATSVAGSVWGARGTNLDSVVGQRRKRLDRDTRSDMSDWNAVSSGRERVCTTDLPERAIGHGQGAGPDATRPA
ncbi:hypothetical protein BDV93DRAFT_512561 [Ceratobasidium sp. AG-I]|nr:hypothetical protein BDV93DRAFT_512561 [Ceratobasidium sp. AG-I]